MKNIRKQSMRFMLTLSMLLATMVAFAQITVNGTVVDAANGEPIIGASVLEIGTTNGTITDFDGNFILTVKSGAKLAISYMGYKTQELDAQPSMNVKLGEDTELLDEVVVVGYGVVKKNDATGSVTAIKPDEMNKALTTTATDMLAGKVAGVVVTSDGGAPGGGATIRIRGGSSLSASNNPLIVIDGLAMDNDGINGVSNPLSMVNPSDIESMTVLKDASATAIYGSRASNGVIIITTKKGKAGSKPKVSYEGNVSISQLTDRVEVLTGDQMRAYATSLGLGSTAMSVLGHENTDWQNAIYRTSVSTDHNVSLMGGTKHMPYRASIGYTLGNGIVKTNQMQRVTASINLSPSFLDDHLSFNLNAKGMYIYNRYADGVQGAALDFDPTQPIYDPSNIGFGGYYQRTVPGSFNDAEGQKPGDKWYSTNNSQSAGNPLASLMQKKNIANSGSFVGNIDGTYKIHGFEDLILHANFGADYSYGKQTLETSPEAYGDHYYGRYGWSEGMKYNLLFNCYAQYYKDFNEKHHFDAMVGYEWQHFYRKGTSEYWGIYQETNLDPALRGTKYNHLTPDDNAWASESYLVSFFGRINYSALNRYMLTATVRGDGSSRFAPGRRWGVFPSVALGWKIKEESFLRDVHWLNDLKLRLGYGITGQQDLNMGDFPYMPTYDVSKQYAYATLGELATDEKKAELDAAGYVLDKDYVISSDNYIFYVHNRPNAYNPNLTWEKTTTYNVGIDFGFLNNRINGAIDYYYRVTDDLINYVTVPAGTNFKNSVTRNIGSLRNQGVEFSVNGVLVDKKNFKWDMSYNVTWNDNKITKLLDAEDENYYVPTGGIRNGQNVQAHKVGYAASSFYVYQTAKNETTGKLYVVDRNEDGKIDEKDKYFYHNPAAPVTMGLSSKWQFYGFDLGITFRASIGNYVYNHILSGNMQNIEASQIYSAKSGGFHNLMLTALQAYYVDGVNPSDYTSQLDLLDYFVENASFVRCDNITLGYSFEKQLKGRVYCTVSNPFVLSRYKGLDPEVFGGIDNNIYPRSLTVSVGTSLSF
ncbi:MAG: TonB-dependent receptor [Paludibacteraceae bacterium]|nr:TonB-dependent receptor [Paludibacteraceae bacterium]